MPFARQHCPICCTPVRAYPRYPRYVCGKCAGEACSEEGRPLVFYNTDICGGFRAEYADSRQPYGSHVCFIKGVRCYADEARFGGIVIEAVDDEPGLGERVQVTRVKASGNGVADRARGALVGLALGDALGAPVEFDAPESIVGRRDYVFSMPGGGPFDWAPGEFTDDTQMALVLARHLRHYEDLDQDELARAFAVWAEDAADVGNQTRTVLDAVSRGQDWRSAIQRLSPDAAGNGSLMRVAPVALAAHAADSAARLAEEQSEVTHPNALCVDACCVFAQLLWTTIHKGEFALEEASSWSRCAEVREALQRSADGATPAMSGYVLHTLTGAPWAVRHASSFEDAVWRAVALGRDADTVGAVTGALAGRAVGLVLDSVVALGAFADEASTVPRRLSR